MDFARELRHCQGLIDEYLGGCFQEEVPQKALYDAMSYSLTAGGKRVRPVLAMQFCAAAGGDPAAALVPGCGVEMLHTYSLIHDDLPCMDDDDLRRGKPTNHVVYGECTAVLAGDALQTAAFESILSANLPVEIRAAAALELARAAGKDGMCAGQVLDMEGETRALDLQELALVHSKKTGALLEAACVIGVLCGGGSEEQLRAARAYAAQIGLAFQVRDDLLDCISTTEQLGKPVGSDVENHKSTYVSLLGQARCEEIIRDCTDQAKRVAKDAFADSEFLCAMADWLAGRMN